jgi:hypothetical protein
MTEPKAHGGKRSGAGRKSTGGRSERLSVRLSSRLARRLRDSGRAGEIIESALEFGDANQDGLPLSFLAEFARIGRMYWPVEGSDGTTIEGIPLDLDDFELWKNWTQWHGDDAPTIEAAYRQYGPMARRVRCVLGKTNPLLRRRDLDLWSGGRCVGVLEAIKLLHGYALIVNDGHLPCGGRDLARFIFWLGQTSESEVGLITTALAAGRLDVAVACGAGDYAVTGEAAVLAKLREGLNVETALDWWARNPEFCRRIDPDIETMAGIPSFLDLAAKTRKLFFWGSLFGSEPDWASLRAFRAAWFPMAAQHGEDLLLHLLERFDVLKASAVRHRLSIEIPGERNPAADYATLGLVPGASRRDIDAAFRRLAQRAHPDKGGDAEHFTRITQARDRLISGTNSR